MEVIVSDSHSPLGLLSSPGVCLWDWRDTESSISLFCPAGWNVLKNHPKETESKLQPATFYNFHPILPSKEFCLGLGPFLHPCSSHFPPLESKPHLSTYLLSSRAFQNIVMQHVNLVNTAFCGYLALSHKENMGNSTGRKLGHW